MAWIIWFITAGIACIVVAAGFVVLAPLQLVMWIARRKPFSQTDPYQFLHYMLYRAWAEPGETTRPYSEWQKNKTLPDDLWVPPAQLERDRRREEQKRAQEESQNGDEAAKTP
jgi:hypothetical protein